MKLFLVLLFAFVIQVAAVFDILRFGAIPTLKNARQPDVSVANANAVAIAKAFEMANASAVDKTIYIPEKIFYITSVWLENMNGITFKIDGTLICHNNISTWPAMPGTTDGAKADAFRFTLFHNFVITGTGTIDGQGYVWWWWSITTALPNADHEDHRFHMIVFKMGTNILVEGVLLKNSPNYHIKADDVHNLEVRHFEIYVDVWRQKEMLNEAGFLDPQHGIPTFPLNTDGIDPAGSEIHIHHGKITNFDDAVVFKPCHADNTYCKNGCSSGSVHDMEIVFSVGLSIGSVPPNNNPACVKNVTFRDTSLMDPLKGIYIKSNPGNSGTGLIQDILYENIFMQRALWWPLWIGPQQMSQPDGSFLGCDMLFPFRSLSCPTNPLVTMTGITLRNVTSIQGTNKFPGVIMCNVSNPCTDFLFENVNFSEGKYAEKTEDFIVAFASGVSVDSTPTPGWV